MWKTEAGCRESEVATGVSRLRKDRACRGLSCPAVLRCFGQRRSASLSHIRRLPPVRQVALFGGKLQREAVVLRGGMSRLDPGETGGERAENGADRRRAAQYSAGLLSGE